MRSAALVILSSIALAGCLDSGPGEDTGGGQDSSSGTFDFRHEHTFSGDGGDEPFELAGDARARVVATFRALGSDNAQLCVGTEGARLSLLDADGAEVWSHSPDVRGLVTGRSDCGTREEEIQLRGAGAWTVHYEGAENTEAYFLLEGSGRT